MPRTARLVFDHAPIVRKNRVLLLDYDQGMEVGPAQFNDATVDPAYVLDIADTGPFTGVVLQKGIARAYYKLDKHKVPLVLKLNGRTNLVKDQDPYAPQICTVEEAIGLGAKAVGYTLYLGSQFEQQMFKEFGQIVRQAHEHKLPVVAWMHARGHNIADETNRDILAYAARVALELGADFADLRYPGDEASLKWVVESAGRCQIVAAGGQAGSIDEVEAMARGAVSAGAAGITVGQSVWQAGKPHEVAEAVGKIIFG